MSIIKKLDLLIANKIAAGEVIEKLANVVKELVENSIDSGANKIDIIVEESGLKSITVSDNGSGMDEFDAVLAFERHSTSKIQHLNDLFRINSLGFRGEALSSIAAVSRVEMITSKDGIGFEVVFEDGKFISKASASANQGTEIKVSHLFYTTPARFKYLKSPQYELAMIVNLVNKYALAYPAISFRLTNDSKLQFVSPGNSRIQDIIANIYNTDIARNLIEFQAESRDYQIKGFTSNPVINRSSNNYMHIFVNQRAIWDSKIISVIRECYDQLIPKNRYPITVLYITCDPSIIDVNIHPRKQEVKFSEYQKLLTLINQTISDKVAIKPIYQKPAQTEYRNTKLEFSETDKAYVSEQISLELDETTESVKTQEAPVRKIPDLEYIGQYLGTYLIFQNETGLYLLDQHAAAERIRYERYLGKMTARHQESQELLLPLELVLSKDILMQLEPYQEQLEKFNIVGKIQENSFLVEQIPSWFYKGYELIYTEAVIMELIKNKDLQKSEIIDDLAKLLACKHSLKANHYITEAEAMQLLQDLRSCKRPYTCPHGRPIIVQFSVQQIEHWFNRVI